MGKEWWEDSPVVSEQAEPAGNWWESSALAPETPAPPRRGGTRAEAKPFVAGSDAGAGRGFVNPEPTDAEPSTLQVAADSFRRGVPSLMQNMSGTALRANAGIIGKIDSVEQALAAGRDPNSFKGDEDPYGVALMTPQQRQQFRAQTMGAAGGNAASIAGAEATKAQYPSPPVVARVTQAKGWQEALSAFASDPVKFIAAIGPESMVQSGPGMVAGMLIPGGAALKGATMGLGSAVTDYGSNIVQGLQEAGVDIRDPVALQAAAKNPELLQRIARQAMAHAGPVGAVDAVSGGMATKLALPGKVATKLAGQPVARELVNMAAQVPVQGAFGGAGEALGELAAGQPLQPGQIIAEVAGEAFSAPAEVATIGAKSVQERMRERAALRTAADQGDIGAAVALADKTGELSRFSQRIEPTFEPEPPVTDPIVDILAAPSVDDAIATAAAALAKTPSDEPKLGAATIPQGSIADRASAALAPMGGTNELGATPEPGLAAGSPGGTVDELGSVAGNGRPAGQPAGAVPEGVVPAAAQAGNDERSAGAAPQALKTNDWKAFSPESGTKGVPRADMPQIKADDRSAFVQFLRARGIDYTENLIPSAALKPTQAEYSPTKVAQSRQHAENTDRAILVSSDGHVLDGHHQMIAAQETGEHANAITLNAPIVKLLEEAKQFPSVRYSEASVRGRLESMRKPAPAQDDERGIVNPIDPNATPVQKIAQLTALTEQNKPIVADLIHEIDAEFGTKSSDNIKANDKILSKAARPSIRKEKPWHDIEHAVQGLSIEEVPVGDITLSGDVPQFKSGANAAGVTEPLGGKFDRTGVAPIQLWRRKSGKLEVISGRHRLDLARRSGEKTIPAQIHDEANGFDQMRAATLDAELNIRDGQGKVKDYVDYFKNSGITESEAEQRGLLSRALGKRGFAIATDGDASLIAAHRAGVLTDEAAVTIAEAAPGDGRLQSVGIRAVQDGKSITQAANTMRAVKLMADDRTDTSGDMFGFDDSAMREAEQMAGIASTKQRELSQRLTAITGAANNPALARAEGINVKHPAAIIRRAQEIKQERARWESWSTDPKLVEEIRAEMAPAPEVAKPTFQKGNSWVLREKATGKVIAETYDQKKVDALNTTKYEAVPIGEYLAGLNKPAAQPPDKRMQVELRKREAVLQSMLKCLS